MHVSARNDKNVNYMRKSARIEKLNVLLMRATLICLVLSIIRQICAGTNYL
jgi:hypothetical protein